MKNKNHDKKSLKRQLLTGTVYVALASVVVAVTVNTTVEMISGKTDLPKVENTDHGNPDLPEISNIPELTVPDIFIPQSGFSNPDSAVSDSPEGITSDIIEALPSPDATLSESVLPSESIPLDPLDPLAIPDSANLGLDKFIKPCNGFVSKGHSIDIPVYSPTMSDYRTHTGVDVVGDLGCEVLCVNGGIVTDIYNDDLYGMTVEMKNRDGYTVIYSNLMPALSAGVEVGTILKTGEPLGGIGETAICEAVETSHVHLEIYDPQGLPLNPEDLISF